MWLKYWFIVDGGKGFEESNNYNIEDMPCGNSQEYGSHTNNKPREIQNYFYHDLNGVEKNNLVVLYRAGENFKNIVGLGVIDKELNSKNAPGNISFRKILKLPLRAYVHFSILKNKLKTMEFVTSPKNMTLCKLWESEFIAILRLIFDNIPNMDQEKKEIIQNIKNNDVAIIDKIEKLNRQLDKITDMEISTEQVEGISTNEKIQGFYEQWKRNQKVRYDAIEKANFSCEISNSHESFLTDEGIRYMEGHHLIPLKVQSTYSNSLDIVDNIICLCPNCHREIHYGKVSTRQKMVEHLFNKKREEELKKKGIDTSLVELKSIYSNIN